MRTIYCTCCFTFVFKLVTDRTCQSLAFALPCQHWATVQTILGLRKNATKSKKWGGFLFASGPDSMEKCSFVFRFTCPSKKPIWRNNAIIVTHCRLRPRLHEDDVKTIGTKSYLSGKKSFRIGLLFTRRRSVSANFWRRYEDDRKSGNFWRRYGNDTITVFV